MLTRSSAFRAVAVNKFFTMVNRKGVAYDNQCVVVVNHVFAINWCFRPGVLRWPSSTERRNADQADDIPGYLPVCDVRLALARPLAFAVSCLKILMEFMRIITRTLKLWIRSVIGVWPALEIRNRIVMAPYLPRLIRFENKEVERLRLRLGTVPTAKIACIIPTYRRPEGLVAAINSILAQERQDFVIVVVDDGAGLPALPGDPRLFAVSLSRNCGIAGLVRNVGIRLSRSEFVTFLDDDNVWTPQHLTVAIEALEQGADLIYTAVRRRRPDGSELDILSIPFDRHRFSDASSFVDTNAIALRRSVCPAFSRMPRPRTMHPREDWEFVWRVSGRARVEHVPVVTVDYLVNPESFYTAWSGTDPEQSVSPS